jgi:integrase
MQIVQPIKDYAKIEQIQGILKKHSLRDWILFTIGINSGIHLSDILLLRVKDVKDKTLIRVKEERTGKEKSFYMSIQLKNGICDYIKDKDDEDFLFPSQRTGHPIKRIRVYRILNEAGKLVGLNDIGTHTLRKTFGYHYYQKTKNVNALRELFNHSAPSITLRYIGIEEHAPMKRNSV